MESFPPISAQPYTHPRPPTTSDNDTRPRRKNSSLGADPRGDTGANALATSRLHQQSPPSTPTESTMKKPQQRERKRKKAKTLLNRWKKMSLKHTWVNPLILVLIILSAYVVSPGEHNPLHHFIFLSYANPAMKERTNTIPAHVGNVTQYGKGPWDIAFVAFYTIVLSFSREFLMQRLIRPIAIYCGIRNRGKQARFMEQGYMTIYFGIFGPFGLFVMTRTPVWYFNVAGMYEGYPHRAHEAYFKAYYLLQASFWAQQGLVLMLQLEKPRKDFRELVLHHIVTLALIGLSYRFHFTYIGVAVYITHDISDFFIAISKILNYLDSVATPAFYTFFICVWAYLRHYINLKILASLLPPFTFTLMNRTFHTGQFATVGDYTLSWPDQQYKSWISQVITFVLLATLQAVNIFWYFLLLRILARYLRTGEQKDERSEDEHEEASTEHSESGGMRTNGQPVSSKPQVLINGQPMPLLHDEVSATGADKKKTKLAQRKVR